MARRCLRPGLLSRTAAPRARPMRRHRGPVSNQPGRGITEAIAGALLPRSAARAVGPPVRVWRGLCPGRDACSKGMVRHG
jgi:hypothetical protein